MDRWEDGSWKRAFTIADQTFEVVVNQENQKTKDHSSIQVQIAGSQLTDSQTKWLLEALEKCMGLNKDLSAFYRFAQKDKTLNSLTKRFLGLKPPRFPTVFEGAINGIACQQVSLDLGIILLNRLCKNYGREVKDLNYSARAFPSPENLMNLTPECFRELGYSRQKGRAIIELSKSIASGNLNLEQLAEEDNTQVLAKLCNLRGIGRWTGEYVLLRGLGRLDVFPADDIGGRRGLRQLLGIDDSLNYNQTRSLVSRWYPYGGFIYFHLLMNRLVQEGCL
jgi:DNA-3-methyladenine glycosylase II